MIKLFIIISLSMVYFNYSMEQKSYLQAEEENKKKQKKKRQVRYGDGTYSNRTKMLYIFPSTWLGNQPKDETEKKYDLKERWNQLSKEEQSETIKCIKNIAFTHKQGVAWFIRSPDDSYDQIVQLHLKNYSNSIELIFDKHNIDHPHIKSVQWVQELEEKIKNSETKT